MKLYLIHHAESYGNIKGKIISTTDFELTEKGIAQSRRIGQKIRRELQGKGISVYCSSLAQKVISSSGAGRRIFSGCKESVPVIRLWGDLKTAGYENWGLSGILIFYLPAGKIHMKVFFINQLRNRDNLISCFLQPCNQGIQRLGRILRSVMA